jgi:cephalosporin hydroxylase
MGNPNVMVAGFDLTITPEARMIEKNFTNVLLFQESSLSNAVPDVILHSGHRLQAIFFDTNHNYEQVKAELMHLRPYITPNVVLVFDDVHSDGNGVLQAIQEFGVNYTPMDHLHTTLGFGVATSLV